MKLYNRVFSAVGLVCISALISVSANAGKPNPLATVMRTSDAQMAVGQSDGVSNGHLLKLMAGYQANRGGGVCGDSSPDLGETCDDGNTTSGDGCDDNCQIEVGSDCTAAIAGITTQNILDNGGFEQGPVVWTETQEFGIPFGPISSPLNCGGCNLANTGEWWVWNGGWSEALATSVDQDVIIPTNATSLQLDIWEAFCVPDGGAGDVVTLEIDGVVVFDTGICTTEDPYAQADTTISLTGAAAIAACGGTGCNDGLTHNIKVRGEMDFNPGDSQTGSIIIDNVRMNIELIPPIPPVPSSCYIGMCGDAVVSDGEACDDGNTDGGDGCSASCAIEEDSFVCINDLADTGFGVAGGALNSSNDIADGSLEQGAPNPDWEEAGTQFAPICSEAFCGAAIASDGDFFGWFGGSSLPNTQTLTQTGVTISSSAETLDFDLFVSVCDSASDVLRVNIDGNTVWERFCTSDMGTYQTQSIDLATATGGPYNDDGTHDIQIEGDTFSVNAGNSNHFVDNIRIEYAATRAAVGSECFALDGVCPTPAGRGGIAIGGFGIEKFEAGLGIMSSFELGTLSGPVNWTTTDDEWTTVGDPSGCGTFDASVANWSGGNLTGGTGEAACADADGGAESLASPDAAAACLDAIDPTLSCQTKAYLCTPALDASSMTDPGVTATVHYQTATQDFDTPDFDDDEIFQVLVGDLPPNPFTISNYRSAGVVIDHNSASLASSRSLTVGVNLDDYRNPAVQDCVDPMEDAPCTVSGVEAPLDDSNLHVCFLYAGIYSWYGQVDNVASRADNCLVGDADFDLVPDDIDNCTNVANPDQEDTDGDGHGNICDADFDNNCFTTFPDLAIMQTGFFSVNPLLDLNSSGGPVNFADLAIMQGLFFTQPGPSANACVPAT